MNYLDKTQLPTLADRLNHAMSQRNFSQEALASAAGCTQASIQKISSGKSQKSRFLPAIARALKVDVDWLELGVVTPSPQSTDETTRKLQPHDGTPLVLGELSLWDDLTPMDAGEIALPLYKEVEIASGLGKSSVQIDDGRKVWFSSYTLRKAGVDPSNAACATNKGNSNHPLILDRATLGVDKGTTKIIDGQIYALDHDGLLRVKFLYRVPGGIRLRSYNFEEFADEDYSFEEVMEQRIQIIGRIFWWSTLNPINSSLLPKN
ncbi:MULTISPECIES: helix-turn-helix transcriptional regulator [unclassified Pseudomonas]|jgi:phage repressor protein C with HTH and peptisase S24 domain|uniref:XRE family transcriptional regulator n=1 Tax=unclassified Pseudomonas TaxID=196821 RepID=UPI00161164EA|nr:MULTISPECIES: helix-turn-helix transcriptional regulator [unclassified Pseudomonas]MBB6287959.1 phage repressor protein C with HTH and peptisase S24 domain [Pseudomonas sp. SJZ073]MBB6312931.1 phage repressor protein C with HTH and peptisase S24 domain [Pseudomonas sp. JAI120]